MAAGAAAWAGAAARAGAWSGWRSATRPLRGGSGRGRGERHTGFRRRRRVRRRVKERLGRAIDRARARQPHPAQTTVAGRRRPRRGRGRRTAARCVGRTLRRPACTGSGSRKLGSVGCPTTRAWSPRPMPHAIRKRPRACARLVSALSRCQLRPVRARHDPIVGERRGSRGRSRRGSRPSKGSTTKLSAKCRPSERSPPFRRRRGSSLQDLAPHALEHEHALPPSATWIDVTDPGGSRGLTGCQPSAAPGCSAESGRLRAAFAPRSRSRATRAAGPACSVPRRQCRGRGCRCRPSSRTSGRPVAPRFARSETSRLLPRGMRMRVGSRQSVRTAPESPQQPISCRRSCRGRRPRCPRCRSRWRQGRARTRTVTVVAGMIPRSTGRGPAPMRAAMQRLADPLGASRQDGRGGAAKGAVISDEDGAGHDQGGRPAPRATPCWS